MTAIAISVLVLVGGFLAVQAAANVQMSRTIRSPLGAATLQLAVATAVLLVAAAATGSLVGVEELATVPTWHLLGGIGSAAYVTAGILLFPRLGAVVTVGLFITGQMLASLVLDTAGWLGVPVEPLGIPNALGVLAVLVGAALVVHAQTRAPVTPALAAVPAVGGTGSSPGGSPAPPSRARSGWLAAGVLGGAVLPVQGAINALLRDDIERPLAVAATSFLLAAGVMAVLLAATVALARETRPQLHRLGTLPSWGWLGGLVGAGYVTSVFLLLPHIGAAPTIALTVAGQQIAGLAVDQYGLLRMPRRPVSARRLAGVAVLLAGVGLLQLG